MRQTRNSTINETKRPHCGRTFTIDEVGYADLVKQICDEEFETQLHEPQELAGQDKQSALEIARAKAMRDQQQSAAMKNAEIHDL